VTWLERIHPGADRAKRFLTARQHRADIDGLEFGPTHRVVSKRTRSADGGGCGIGGSGNARVLRARSRRVLLFMAVFYF
jgi:hypothetical protein